MFLKVPSVLIEAEVLEHLVSISFNDFLAILYGKTIGTDGFSQGFRNRELEDHLFLKGFVEKAKVDVLVGSVGLERAIDGVRWKFDLIGGIGVFQRGVEAPAKGTFADEVDRDQQLIVERWEVDSEAPEVLGDLREIST